MRVLIVLIPGIRGITRIFFRGGKVIFPDFFPGVKCFFPVENSHFATPKKISVILKSEKQKKKKKEKKSSPYFATFPPSIFNFPPSFFSFFFDFPSFLLHFLFFLASLFPVGQQKISRWEVSGGTLPPLPPAVTPLPGTQMAFEVWL